MSTSRPKLPGHGGEDLPGRGVVVHHQHAHPQQLFGQEHAARHRLCLQPETGGEVEGRALAGLALDPDPPLHLLHQVLRYGQPQAGAAVFAGGGGVGLAEGLEHLAALFRGHADAGIAHPEVQLDAAVILGHLVNADDDLALFGELDGVVAQVDQHLPQPQRVADQGGRHVRRTVEQQLQPLVLGLHPHQVGQVVHDIFQVEVDLLHRHLAGLDLGEIEDVVDDAQQVLAGALHLLDVVAAASCPARSAAPGGTCR